MCEKQKASASGVIGLGFVGAALRQAIQEVAGFEVVAFDLNPERSDVPDIDALVRRVGPDGVVFVAVNTPMCRNGSCDTSNVEAVVRYVADAATRAGVRVTVCIKSTCVPGTAERLDDLWDAIDVVFSPEFLTEMNPIRDLLASNRVVIGGRSEAAVERVAAIYRSALPDAQICKTTSTTAEFVKYVSNCFLAVKVSLANELADVADAIGIDYADAIELATKDPRLGTTHWSVPGPDGYSGFGGHCLPKDLMAIIHLTDVLGCENKVLRAAWDTNLAVRKPKDRDWERMPGRAVQGPAPSNAAAVAH
jgi:nucleotide sugar dehydrogenase